MGPITNGHSMDENCLHLSITAPKDVKKAPVLVWLHGGAYISGGGDLDCYQPIGLAQRGLVCVNITYRLGVFGYLRLDGISPANLGLLDQRAALYWIQDNISAFGGDPTNVTMVGQSAGADSILCLMTAEETTGLFHRAILLSPPLREIRARSATGPLLSVKAETLFTKDPRTMTVDELLEMQKKLLLDPVRKRVMLFAPSPGFYPLPSEEELYQKLTQASKNIPILIGWTSHDGRPFSSLMGPSSLYKLPLIGLLLENLKTWYITRSYFRWPCQKFHSKNLRAGGVSTSCSFKWRATNSGLGACHCIDIPFVLGTWDSWKSAAMLKGDDSKEEISRLGKDLKDLWVAFAQGSRLRSRHIRIYRGFAISQKLFMS